MRESKRISEHMKESERGGKAVKVYVTNDKRGWLEQWRKGSERTEN